MTSPPPDFVTFTGADARTDVARMAAIQRRWGRVEWGILFSPKLQGEGRYPPAAFVESLAGRGLRLAAHLCGEHARQALRGEGAVLGSVARGTFARVQVNTREPADTSALADLATSWGAERAILQARGPFPDDDRVDWLSDRSEGTGTAPESWPAGTSPHARVGYAGGLGPDTVGVALPAIAAAAGGLPYWIDMETRVRSRDWFDLDACERVLEAVYGPA